MIYHGDLAAGSEKSRQGRKTFGVPISECSVAHCQGLGSKSRAPDPAMNRGAIVFRPEGLA